MLVYFHLTNTHHDFTVKIFVDCPNSKTNHTFQLQHFVIVHQVINMPCQVFAYNHNSSFFWSCSCIITICTITSYVIIFAWMAFKIIPTCINQNYPACVEVYLWGNHHANIFNLNFKNHILFI